MSHQVLYRFFDNQDNLLYVGISNTWYQRFHDHERKAGWFSKVAYSTFEWHDSRESVEAAELVAIRTENPKFNKANNPSYETTVDHFAKIKLWTYSDVPADKAHEALIRYMKEYISVRLTVHRKQSKWIALAFLGTYYDIGPFGHIQCRNCDALANNANIHRWESDAYDSLELTDAAN
jgi:predicted GIY-YIG superfamily endonuclease